MTAKMGYAKRLWYAMHDVVSSVIAEKHPGPIRELAEIADGARLVWCEETIEEATRLLLPLLPKFIPYKLFPQTSEALHHLYKLLKEIADLEPPAKQR